MTNPLPSKVLSHVETTQWSHKLSESYKVLVVNMNICKSINNANNNDSSSNRYNLIKRN